MTWERGTGGVGARWGRLVTRAVVLVALVALPALAQVPTAPGVKVGEGRLHPFLQVDGRFDSQVGYFNLLAASPELILHVRPGLNFNLDNDSTMVAFDGAAEYLWYTGLLTPASKQLSRVQANVGLDARFNRDGAAEVQISDRLTRSDRTQNPAVPIGVISLFNNARLAVPIHPGGRALEVTPSVAFGLEFFDPLLTGTIPGCTTCNATTVSQMNYGNLNFGLSGRWKFLPKTAVVLDASFDYRLYFTAAANLPGLVLRVQTGLVGLISPRISVTLLAGYGGNLASAAPLHSAIGHAEVAYLPTENTRVALGYMRTVQPVSTLGSFIDDRGYLQGRVGLLGGRLSITADVSADYFWYFLPTPRNDLLLSIGAGPSFVVTSWFTVGASYRLGYRYSPATVSYVRHEAILNLNFHY